MHRRLLTPLLGAFLALGTGGCVPKESAAPIMLSCTGAAATDETVVATLCDALAAEIAERVAERALRRASPKGPRPPGTWDGVLEVVRTEPDFWEGRLTWEVAGAQGGAGRTVGPLVQISSMDAPLGSGAYRRFARGILKVSQPAF